jgi:hypothetical protein
MSLELTPSVRALQWLVTTVGICSSIESFWERSSAPNRSAALCTQEEVVLCQHPKTKSPLT